MFLLFTFTFALFRPVPYTLVTFSYLLISSYLILSLIISSYLILSPSHHFTLYDGQHFVFSSLLSLFSLPHLILFFFPFFFSPLLFSFFFFFSPPPSPLLLLLLLLLLFRVHGDALQCGRN